MPHLRNEMCSQYVPRRSQRVKIFIADIKVKKLHDPLIS